MSLIGKSKGRPITKIQFEKIVKQFTIFVKRELQIIQNVSIHFVDDASYAKNVKAFGEISSDNVIRVSIINRHPMDILRTLAHEMTHYKQDVTRGISKTDSSAGSAIENQANAKAGELMRKFGKLHPEYFELTSIK